MGKRPGEAVETGAGYEAIEIVVKVKVNILGSRQLHGAAGELIDRSKERRGRH